MPQGNVKPPHKIYFPRKAQSPVSDFCYAQNWVCNRAIRTALHTTYRVYSKTIPRYKLKRVKKLLFSSTSLYFRSIPFSKHELLLYLFASPHAVSERAESLLVHLMMMTWSTKLLTICKLKRAKEDDWCRWLVACLDQWLPITFLQWAEES